MVDRKTIKIDETDFEFFGEIAEDGESQSDTFHRILSMATQFQEAQEAGTTLVPTSTQNTLDRFFGPQDLVNMPVEQLVPLVDGYTASVNERITESKERQEELKLKAEEVRRERAEINRDSKKDTMEKQLEIVKIRAGIIRPEDGEQQ
ncbi:MAG: hypothetical protein SVY15_04130 [Halobacteriota archaeon]|nr:hypothetical protein [Halobacteriota archaeon]